MQACYPASAGRPAAVNRLPGHQLIDSCAAATLRCATTCPPHMHSAALNRFDCERLSQADAASPSGLAESLHFGAPTMLQALPTQRTHCHDGSLRRTRQHPAPLMPACLQSTAVPPASYQPESFLDFSRADQHSSPCVAGGASRLSYPNSPCSGHRSHNASAAHFDTGRLAPYVLPHSNAAHHRQPAEVPPTTLRELYRHSAAQHAQHEAYRAQRHMYETPPAAMDAFDIALETDLRPRMSTDTVPCALDSRAQRSCGDQFQQLSARPQGVMRSSPGAGTRRQTAQAPQVYSSPMLAKQPLRQPAQRVLRPRAQWRPRTKPYLFDSMLQQVEQLHACDGGPQQQRGLRRKDAPIDSYYGGEARQPAKRACRPAAAAPCAVYAPGSASVLREAARPAVRGNQSVPRAEPAPQPTPRGCRTWEVMHDIASVPDGQWHHEFLNDLAGLLGSEAVQEARPAPPELDTLSCAGGRGSVCGAECRTRQPLWRRHTVPGWQQTPVLEHSVHSMYEGVGEN